MEPRCPWIVGTVSVIPVSLVADVMLSVQDTAFVSVISVSVINSLDGEAHFVKCPDVPVLTGRTAVEMENATAQTISASVNQVSVNSIIFYLNSVFYPNTLFPL